MKVHGHWKIQFSVRSTILSIWSDNNIYSQLINQYFVEIYWKYFKSSFIIGLIIIRCWIFVSVFGEHISSKEKNGSFYSNVVYQNSTLYNVMQCHNRDVLILYGIFPVYLEFSWFMEHLNSWMTDSDINFPVVPMPTGVHTFLCPLATDTFLCFSFFFGLVYIWNRFIYFSFVANRLSSFGKVSTQRKEKKTQTLVA